MVVLMHSARVKVESIQIRRRGAEKGSCIEVRWQLVNSWPSGYECRLPCDCHVESLSMIDVYCTRELHGHARRNGARRTARCRKARASTFQHAQRPRVRSAGGQYGHADHWHAYDLASSVCPRRTPLRDHWTSPRLFALALRTHAGAHSTRAGRAHARTGTQRRGSRRVDAAGPPTSVRVLWTLANSIS